jgi:hypothetical protein
MAVTELQAELQFASMLETLGLTVSRQVRRGAKRIDIVASHGECHVSIEVKLRDWRRGAAQAYLNGAYFDCLMLAMPAGSTGAIDHSLLGELGVGLVEFGDGGIQVIVRPDAPLPVPLRRREAV